jgi:hypothetical protein
MEQQAGHGPGAQRGLLLTGLGVRLRMEVRQCDRTQDAVAPFALAYYRYERIVQDVAIYCEQLFLTNEGGRSGTIASLFDI